MKEKFELGERYRKLSSDLEFVEEHLTTAVLMMERIKLSLSERKCETALEDEFIRVVLENMDRQTPIAELVRDIQWIRDGCPEGGDLAEHVLGQAERVVSGLSPISAHGEQLSGPSAHGEQLRNTGHNKPSGPLRNA